MGDDYGMMMAALQSFNNSLANSANAIIAGQNSKLDKQFSKEMSEWQWQRNLDAWHMQNKYNLPINQYRRQIEGLQANGLNPNLVYGSSSSVSGAAGSISPYKFEGYHSTAVPRFSGASGIEGLLNTRLLQTQIAAQEANNRLINARADNEEARNPGVMAKSDEAAYRWNKIQNNLLGNYDEAIQASIAKEYWSGIKTEHEANTAHFKRDIAFYEAAMAEWLNTEEVPGLGMTFRQFAELYKSYLPAQQFANLKASTLNYFSQIAYRKSQGELLDLKKEYQRAVNRFAWLGRSLGNDWSNVVLSGLMYLFGDDWKEAMDKAANWMGDHRDDYSPTAPTP